MLVAGCGGADEAKERTTRPAISEGVRLEKIGDFDQPLYVTQPPGDRRDLFVVEQTGAIKAVRDGGTLARPFLDLSDEVSCCGEQGLLSLAFAPNYRESGRLYVDYTDRSGDTRVVEYRRSDSNPLVADPASRRVVMRVDQPASNHNGGLVLFGPDGLLYIGLGDGGFEGDPDRVGQDLSTPLGKILRIDPRPSGRRPYTVPDDNPFVDRAGARPEIWAYGLRNPWRFSFDPASRAIAIGDVGQQRFEEVDLERLSVARGANFGWSAYEGFSRYNDDQTAPDAVPPVLAYGHDAGCSITGGYVVRDRSVPSLYGRYVYGDFCAGELRSFTADPGHGATDDRRLDLDVPSLSSFGQDVAGHVYATSLDGPVYRLVGPHGR